MGGGSIYYLVTLYLLATFASAHAVSDADALLQLRGLAVDSSLQSWQAGTDPCGGLAACSLGACSWAHVACDQHRVSQMDLGGLGLQGSIPASWQPPTLLKVLDLSNNRQLCGSLPEPLVRRGPTTTTIKAADSRIGQSCAPPGSSAAAVGAGAGDGGATLSSMAKGLLGAGVGVGVLAGAAAASVFFLRRRRGNSQEVLVSHDLARVHDSVIVTKQKKQVRAIALSSAAQLGSGPKDTDGVPQVARERPDLRMVAFADSTGYGSPEEEKQRLRAANIQDSVVIIRSRLASGQLPEAEGGDDGSRDGYGCSSEAEEHSHTEVAHSLTADDQQGFQVVAFPPGSAGARDDQHSTAPGADQPVEQHSSTLRRGPLRTTSSKRVKFMAATVVAPVVGEPHSTG